ncbi:TSUP family transporter [uncultured Caballeronia sp.]|uniref:sulfite exporter TauE/SafE family protein n=1 Tax=uncultured Caballeronia sp. TaxID=1827198 RepID=UPI001575AE79
MSLSLALGFVVGLVLGLTGAGGGILAVPALVVGMHWSIQQAAPVALIAISGSAAVGAVEAFCARLVRYRAALLIAVAGVPATSIGLSVAHQLPQRALLFVFGGVMLLVAFRLIYQASKEAVAASDTAWCVGRINPTTGRLTWAASMTAALIGIGALTGFMTGLLGVGGGFVIVPLLRKFTNVPLHGVVATSLMVIALIGTGGVIATVAHGISFPANFALVFSVTTVLGMGAGRFASRKLSGRRLQIGFACVLLFVSLGLMSKAALGV